MAQTPKDYSLEAILAELREAPYRIGVFGEFGAGKSTFLNALMGEDILSVATEPTTATPTRIQWARVFNVLVYGKPASPEAEPPVLASLHPVGAEPVWARLMKDGLLNTLQLHHETTAIRRFLERWTTEGQDADKTHEVVIQLPQPFLKAQLVFIDTPGVNNEFTKHHAITQRVLEGVDFALCVVDGRSGGKASEMRFINTVAEKAAFTWVVVNKVDLIDPDEREELLETIHGALRGFWPAGAGPCPKPLGVSSLAALDPDRASRFPDLAAAFAGFREELRRMSERQRPRRILERCGQWDQVRIRAAHKAAEDGHFADAHEKLLDVLTLYQDAELEIPDGLVDKIRICEDAMKGATSRIHEAHAMVDKAAVILLRNEPNEEVRQLLRQAGAIFLQAQERDPAFEKLARQALGDEANRFLYLGGNPEKICIEALACIEGGTSESEKQRGVNLLRPIADQGYAKAQSRLGWCLLNGIGVPQDAVQAISWFRKAAGQGHAEAQFCLGFSYANGQGVGQDLVQAVHCYRKAAEQGHADAQFTLGICYDNGQGVGQDHAQAVHWYRKAAERGHDSGQLNLGISYENGQGVGQDPVQAVHWYRKAAEQGLALGQLYMGIAYDKGEGVGQDLALAVQWYRKAAEQGEADAQSCLGFCYANGQGVGQDLVQAVHWYRKAAEQGHADAQLNLGIGYDNGQGVGQDSAQAVHWYGKAAEQGQAVAQDALGLCFESGRGVGKSPTQALEWYRLAAEQGNTQALIHLANCHANGAGVPRDPYQAATILSKAAELGNADAQLAIGQYYATGFGVSRSWAVATYWWEKARAAGNERALDFLSGNYCPQCNHPLGAGVSICQTKGCTYELSRR